MTKEVVDIRNRLKRTVEDFPSFMSSSASLDTYGKMVNGCLDTYNREKESFVEVQNAYEDFNGTFRVYLRVKPVLAGETLVKFDFLNDPKTTSTFEKLNHVFSNNESQGTNLCVLAYGQSGSGKTYYMWDFVNLLFYGLAVKKDSLWAKWVHMVKSRGRSIWAVKTNVNDSWGWKHILEIRDKIKDHVKLYDARFKEDMKVNEIVSDEKWNWQREWMKEFPAITGLLDPLTTD
ncbi:RNA-directed DNA polymerase, eukaryota, reverse transcriptase zinc-binding domain protein [Tanacetum coccineum]